MKRIRIELNDEQSAKVRASLELMPPVPAPPVSRAQVLYIVFLHAVIVVLLGSLWLGFTPF